MFVVSVWAYQSCQYSYGTNLKMKVIYNRHLQTVSLLNMWRFRIISYKSWKYEILNFKWTATSNSSAVLKESHYVEKQTVLNTGAILNKKRSMLYLQHFVIMLYIQTPPICSAVCWKHTGSFPYHERNGWGARRYFSFRVEASQRSSLRRRKPCLDDFADIELLRETQRGDMFDPEETEYLLEDF